METPQEEEMNKKLIDIMGVETMCFNDRDDGMACMNPATKKIYQATYNGTSVSKSVPTPPDYDYEDQEFKVKDINAQCKITTAEREGREQSVLMCFTDKENADFSKLEKHLKNMDKMLDETLKSI